MHVCIIYTDTLCLKCRDYASPQNAVQVLADTLTAQKTLIGFQMLAMSNVLGNLHIASQSMRIIFVLFHELILPMIHGLFAK